MADRDLRPSDPILGRAVDSLRALPAVDRDAIARTMAAAARLRAEDTEPNEDDLVAPITERRPYGRWTALVAAAAVLIAVGAAVVWREGRSAAPVVASVTARSASTRPPATGTRTGTAPVIPAVASADEMEAAAVPTQFVYDGPAHHVTLVGDFNRWDEHATPLVREPGSALWSVTVPLQRGRHVYAFMVDSTWTTDRRAPVSRDPDFGVEGSVIIVGRP